MYSLDPDRLHVSRMHLVQWLSSELRLSLGAMSLTFVTGGGWCEWIPAGRRLMTRDVCFLPSLLTFVIEIEANPRLRDGMALEL